LAKNAAPEIPIDRIGHLHGRIQFEVRARRGHCREPECPTAPGKPPPARNPGVGLFRSERHGLRQFVEARPGSRCCRKAHRTPDRSHTNRVVPLLPVKRRNQRRAQLFLGPRRVNNRAGHRARHDDARRIGNSIQRLLRLAGGNRGVLVANSRFNVRWLYLPGVVRVPVNRLWLRSR